MDLRDIIDAAKEQGFRVNQLKSGHWAFYAPDRSKHPVFFSGTPGDVRAIRNLLGKLRNVGFIWPWAGRIKKK